jgi:ribonuclease Z
MYFKVIVLGSNSAIPTLERNPSAYLVNHRERLFLVDCAEGTQVQLRKTRLRIQRIRHIFISHLHGDHFFGLIGLITTLHLLGRKEELHIYAHADLEAILNRQLEVSDTRLVYPLVFHPIPPDTHAVLCEDDKLSVEAFPMNHRIHTSGFVFREKPNKRRIRQEMIRDLNIPWSELKKLKEGHDYTDPHGRIYGNEELTLPPHPSLSFAYCSDTLYDESIVPYIRGVDLLIHEATFANDLVSMAREKYHSTAEEAATIALKADARKLLITHFSSRYDSPYILLEEAKKVFPNTLLAEDGKEIEVG